MYFQSIKQALRAAVVILTGFILGGADTGGAQEAPSRIETGLMIGVALPSGRPHIRNAMYGSAQLAFRASDALWLITEGGAVPTVSDYDGTFPINLFFIRTALRYEFAPMPVLKAAAPFVTAGATYLDFDPAGQADAQNDLRQWGMNGGGGMTYTINRRLGARITGHVSIIRTRADRFPIVSRSTDKRTSLLSFIGIGLILRL